jgi:hypothetical protein
MAEPAGRPLPTLAPFRMHDAFLINCVGALLVDPAAARDQAEDAIEGIRLVLPMASRDSILMQDLARAAGDLVLAWPGRFERTEGLNPYARAQFDAGVALAAVFRVRAAQAHAQLYAAESAT